MADKKISAYAGYASGADVATADQLITVDASVGGNKKLTVAQLVDALNIHGNGRWTLIDTSNYTAAPRLAEYDGAAFNDISQWAAATGYVSGDWMKPTSANGYIYECTTNGTSAGSEPAWGTTIGGDTADNTTAWRCRGLHVVTTSSDLSTIMPVGTPVKFTYNSTTYYGVVVGISASRIAIAGPPLSSSYSLTALYYGRPEMLVQKDFYINGAYGDGAADLLGTDADTAFDWNMVAAYLVRFRIRHDTDDTGANQPQVNVKVNGSAVSLNDGSDGVTAGTTWQEGHWASMSATLYDIQPDEALEINCTQAGSNSDAEDLTASCVFVLP